jgi:hypothetical protein
MVSNLLFLKVQTKNSFNGRLGYSNTIRAKFGNEYSFGYTYVTIDKLPAEGMKIFVTLDKSNKEITSMSIQQSTHRKKSG